MTTMAVAGREGLRLALASKPRTATVVATIATATTVGTVVEDQVVGCAALATAVLIAARRSPRSERVESAHAWRRAGAGRAPIWMSGTVEALVLGWGATLLGALVGLVARVATGADGSGGRAAGYIAVQMALLTVAAAAPTSRIGLRAQRARTTRALGVGTRAVIVTLSVAAMFATAVRITSDFDLAIGGSVIITLLSLVGVLISGLVPSWVIRALGRVPRLAPAAAIAQRHRTPATVRAVIAAAFAFAVATSVLGSSIGARPETLIALERRLDRLPVLPANVALVRLDPDQPLALLSLDVNGFNRRQLDPALRRALASVAPGAERIELRHLDVVSVDLLCDCPSGPYIVEEPRLASIYGDGLRSSSPTGVAGSNRTPVADATSRVLARDDLALLLEKGEQLPRASFRGAAFNEVPASTVASRDMPTKVRSVLIASGTALTGAQLDRLRQLARRTPTPPGTHLTVIGPHGQLLPRTASKNLDASQTSSLRDVPWATTSEAARWSVTAAAALFALAALLATLAVDTFDRRRDVHRLERLGATPGQVRAGAALHAGALFAAIAVTSAVVVTVLVRAGTRAFNKVQPGIPVPFQVPWALLAAIVLGVPAVAAALAAWIARPDSQSRHGM